MMGYYVEVPDHKGKANQLVQLHGGKIVSCPESFDAIPEGKGLIVVVDNGPFEAAGFVYDKAEFRDFTDPSDFRPHHFILLDLDLAKSLSGYRSP